MKPRKYKLLFGSLSLLFTQQHLSYVFRRFCSVPNTYFKALKNKKNLVLAIFAFFLSTITHSQEQRENSTNKFILVENYTEKDFESSKSIDCYEKMYTITKTESLLYPSDSGFENESNVLSYYWKPAAWMQTYNDENDDKIDRWKYYIGENVVQEFDRDQDGFPEEREWMRFRSWPSQELERHLKYERHILKSIVDFPNYFPRWKPKTRHETPPPNAKFLQISEDKNSLVQDNTKTDYFLIEIDRDADGFIDQIFYFKRLYTLTKTIFIPDKNSASIFITYWEQKPINTVKMFDENQNGKIDKWEYYLVEYDLLVEESDKNEDGILEWQAWYYRRSKDRTWQYEKDPDEVKESVGKDLFLFPKVTIETEYETPPPNAKFVDEQEW